MRARAAGNDPSKLAAVTAAHAKAALARVSTAKGLLAKSAPKERLEAEAKLKTKRKARRAAVRRAAMRPMSPKEWAEEAAKDLEDEEDEEPPQLFFGRCDCSTDAAMGWIRKQAEEQQRRGSASPVGSLSPLATAACYQKAAR